MLNPEGCLEILNTDFIPVDDTVEDDTFVDDATVVVSEDAANAVAEVSDVDVVGGCSFLKNACPVNAVGPKEDNAVLLGKVGVLYRDWAGAASVAGDRDFSSCDACDAWDD